MSYSQQKQLAYAVAALAALIGVIQLGNAELLGLSPRALAWLGIAGAFLAVLAGFLPSVRNLGTDPTFLEHRISELPPRKRKALATKLADRAAKDAAVMQPDGTIAKPLPPNPRHPRKVTESNQV